MSLFLSRLTLRRDPATDALKQLIDPSERARALDAHHRLLWTAFADDPDRRRDFLWRSDGHGVFFVLSARPPANAPLFAPPEVKDFAPDLSAGDRLVFTLRANATKDRPTRHLATSKQGGSRDRRVDVVMDALHAMPAGAPRAEARMRVAAEQAEKWLSAQGARNGFAVCDLAVEDYSVMALPGHAGRRAGQPQFGVLDLTGEIEVTDPQAFVTKLGGGFGRAKAFGCGLMLIRRSG
jgi:CRISPR system Cascade subunit CasE